MSTTSDDGAVPEVGNLRGNLFREAPADLLARLVASHPIPAVSEAIQRMRENPDQSLTVACETIATLAEYLHRIKRLAQSLAEESTRE